jgi:hypothetical protein
VIQTPGKYSGRLSNTIVKTSCGTQCLFGSIAVRAMPVVVTSSVFSGQAILFRDCFLFGLAQAEFAQNYAKNASHSVFSHMKAVTESLAGIRSQGIDPDQYLARHLIRGHITYFLKGNIEEPFNSGTHYLIRKSLYQT